jgi:hypothetical protein
MTSTRRIRLRWRLALIALALALVALVAPVPASEAHTCTPDAEIGIRGRLLLPNGSGFSVLDLPGRASQQIAVTPAQGLTTAVASAPEGGLLAVTRFWRPPADKVGGQDILLIGPDGGAPVATIERSQPGESLGSPSWLPDGSLVFERRKLGGANEVVQVDRARPGEPAERLADGAASPAASPDGSLLVMTRPADQANQGDVLVARPLEGGPEQVLVDGTRRLSIAFPRFSADGAWIAFTGASGDATSSVQPAQMPVPSPTLDARVRLPRSAAYLIGATPVSAHGIPWDVWIIRPDGRDLHRVTSFFDDDSSAAWSPDGHWLMTYSAEALHAVAVDGSASFCIANAGGYGGIEWLP